MGKKRHPPTLAEQIRTARGDRSQREVAATAGIPREYLIHIEQGVRLTGPEDTLRRIATALGTPLVIQPLTSK
jgi:transcriptional regulator with XRE-family HTH domain